jgi:hypothetical protein
MTHAKVLQRMKEYNWNPEDHGIERAEDQLEKRFLALAKEAKSPVKKEITAIYRIRENNHEYFWYAEEWSAKDSLGNTIQHYKNPIGKYEEPDFRVEIDPATGDKVATEILSQETKYELEWPKDFTKEMEKRLYKKVSLTVVTMNRKYGGFTWEDYKERRFDDLVTFGRFGTFNPTSKELEKQKGNKK